MKLLTLLTSTLEGSDSSNIVELVGWKPLSLISEQYVKGRQLESKLLKRMFLSAQNLEYYFIKYISEKIFFSPVLHCTPDALSYVVVCFIFHESQPKNFKMRCKEYKQHCQSLLNRECEYCPYATPEFCVWILQWVAIDTEGTGCYDVSGESGHRLLHLYCGTWQQTVLVLLPRFSFANSEVSTNSCFVTLIPNFLTSANQRILIKQASVGATALPEGQ